MSDNRKSNIECYEFQTALGEYARRFAVERRGRSKARTRQR